MRYSLIIRSVAILLLAGCASVAQAAEKEAGATPNPLAIVFDTALWTIVIFLGLLFILNKKAWGPIVEGLQKREEAIRSSLDEAKKVRSDMAAMKAEFEKELAETHQQIPKLMEDARKKAEELGAEMRAKAATDIQTERDRLRREIDIATDQAIKKLWEEAAQLATLISAKAIGKSLGEDDHRRLIDEALHEMTTRNN